MSNQVALSACVNRAKRIIEKSESLTLPDQITIPATVMIYADKRISELHTSWQCAQSEADLYARRISHLRGILEEFMDDEEIDKCIEYIK